MPLTTSTPVVGTSNTAILSSFLSWIGSKGTLTLDTHPIVLLATICGKQLTEISQAVMDVSYWWDCGGDGGTALALMPEEGWRFIWSVVVFVWTVVVFVIDFYFFKRFNFVCYLIFRYFRVCNLKRGVINTDRRMFIRMAEQTMGPMSP